MQNLNIKRRQVACFLLLLVTLAFLTWQAQAQNIQAVNPTYDISWSTVDAGGGYSADSSYALSSSAGQLSQAINDGDGFQVESGFIAGLQPARYGIFLPISANQ